MTENPGNQPPALDPLEPTKLAQPEPPPVTTAAEPSAPPPAQPPAPPPPPAAPSIATASEPVVPPPVPPAAQPPYAPFAPPPQKKGPSALKIVLIIVAIFVGLGIIAAGFVSYAVYKFARSAHMSTSTQPATAADLGVPPYPGAEQGKSIRMTMMGNDMVTGTFLTSDPKEQVIVFYKSNLGPGAVDVTTFNGESLKLEKGSGESVMVTVSNQPGGLGGRTQIVVLHTTKATSPSN